jgi:hypothetical protein
MSREKGYCSLFDSGVKKMLEGSTTAEEVLRVTFAETAINKPPMARCTDQKWRADV